jgi:hypothetical protein
MEEAREDGALEWDAVEGRWMSALDAAREDAEGVVRAERRRDTVGCRYGLAIFRGGVNVPCGVVVVDICSAVGWGDNDGFGGSVD